MPQIKEGVYLQTTKGKIGTGVTSSSVVYKNYYAVRTAGTKVELYLLDDDLKPLGLKETKDPTSLQAEFEYQPAMQENFVSAMQGLGLNKTAPAPKKSAPAPQATQEKPWWEQ